jgi:hypothetical protein
MSAVSPIWIVGAGAVLLIVTAKPKRRRTALLRATQVTPAGAANHAQSSSGLRIENGKLKVVNWTEWMRKGPALIHVSLQEGSKDPEEVTTNVLRRLFPERPWPPEPDDPVFATWREMNALVGKALDTPVRPHFEVVS